MARIHRNARHDRDTLARAFIVRASEAINRFQQIKDALAEKHREEQQGRAGENWIAEVGILTAQAYRAMGRVDALLEAFALACDYPDAHEAHAELGVRWGMLVGSANEIGTIAQINRYVADVVTRDLARPSTRRVVIHSDDTRQHIAENGGDA